MAEQIFFDDGPDARGLRPSRRAAIMAWLASEQDRWILWAPVALGAGIVGYFRLPTEPPAGLAPGLLILSAVLAWRFRNRPFAVVVLTITGLLATGFTAAQLRTGFVDAPALERRTGPAPVEGRVVAIDRLVNDTRLVLDTVHLEGAESPPARVRLRVKEAPGFSVGARVRVKAILQPRPKPVAPGAFDFGRQLFFERIGAVGYATGRIEVLPEAEGRSWGDSPLVWESLRQQIAAHVDRHMDGAAAAVAIALLTGETASIPGPVLEAIQASGLAHLLAISGLNIGLVAGIVFFLVRAGLALIEPVALRWPIKKWAALAALAGATAYTLLVGAPIPAQRALIMTGLALVAVMLDRNPLSWRLILFAAALLLLFRPESVLGPSFQMSFAAVVALIAGYEAFSPLLGARRGRIGALPRAGLYVAGMAATSVLAGLATLPFTLYHFQQIQLYGVLANMLAVPLTSFWIMPTGLLACIAMPVGLEALPLAAMEWGLGLLMAIARWVAGLPGASIRTIAMPDWGLAAIAIGGLWLAFWTRWPRLLGLAGIVAGGISMATAAGPDMLVSGRGTLVALRGPDGRLMLSSRRADRFSGEIWLRHNAQEDASVWPGQGEAMDGRLRCDSAGCVWQAPNGSRVAIVKEREALAEDCRRADIVVSLVPAGRCAAPAVIDYFDLWRLGTHALYFEPEGLRVETVEGARGMRPWTGRHSSGLGSQ